MIAYALATVKASGQELEGSGPRRARFGQMPGACASRPGESADHVPWDIFVSGTLALTQSVFTTYRHWCKLEAEA